MKNLIILVFLALVLFFSACAKEKVTSEEAGVEFTLTNVAYKNLNFPFAEVDKALEKAFAEFGYKVVEENETPDGRELYCVAEELDLEFEIEIFSLIPEVTKMSVKAKTAMIDRDKKAAAELINETDRILKEKL